MEGNGAQRERDGSHSGLDEARLCVSSAVSPFRRQAHWLSHPSTRARALLGLFVVVALFTIAVDHSRVPRRITKVEAFESSSERVCR